ncbi:MAG TPA: hypothetical protein VMT47_13105 [Polyangia bacterium]|nr:hypothetical protein [Polyangia bacterium]
MTVIPVSQDALASVGRVKPTGALEQVPTCVWLVPGLSFGSCLSVSAGQVALVPV